jgi:hypothetical protein
MKQARLPLWLSALVVLLSSHQLHVRPRWSRLFSIAYGCRRSYSGKRVCSAT